jgi:hypothetical protein
MSIASSGRKMIPAHDQLRKLRKLSATRTWQLYLQAIGSRENR